jgi:predicted NAD/FAD-binding protein
MKVAVIGSGVSGLAVTWVSFSEKNLLGFLLTRSSGPE